MLGRGVVSQHRLAGQVSEADLVEFGEGVGGGQGAPFTLESRLRAEGADFTAGAPWSEFTVTDRNLITGRTPALRLPWHGSS